MAMCYFSRLKVHWNSLDVFTVLFWTRWQFRWHRWNLLDSVWTMRSSYCRSRRHRPKRLRLTSRPAKQSNAFIYIQMQMLSSAWTIDIHNAKLIPCKQQVEQHCRIVLIQRLMLLFSLNMVLVLFTGRNESLANESTFLAQGSCINHKEVTYCPIYFNIFLLIVRLYRTSADSILLVAPPGNPLKADDIASLR